MANEALLKVKGMSGGVEEDTSKATVLAVSPPTSHAVMAPAENVGKHLSVSIDPAPKDTPARSKASTRTPRSHLLRLIKIQEDAWSPSSRVSRDEKTAAILSMSRDKRKVSVKKMGEDFPKGSNALDLLRRSDHQRGNRK